MPPLTPQHAAVDAGPPPGNKVSGPAPALIGASVGRHGRVARRVGAAVLAFLKLSVFFWGALALWYQAATPWRWPLLLGWGAMGALALASPWLRRRRWLRLLPVGATLLLFAWWQTLTPSHARAWADDVARLLHAEVDGDRVTLHNVRNFTWRGPTDYSPQWETREYDLNQLVSADLLLSYWMGPAIAHTLVSFGFADGRHLVFSLEIRKEKHEAFSALAGFFREYEAVIVAADENDIVRVRTNMRGEQVRLYRLALDQAQLRSAFLGYLQEAERLRQEPAFYNTLTSNCTTIVYDLARQLVPGLPMDYRLLLSGYFAGYAYEHQGLMPGYGFATLRDKSDITSRARAFQGTPSQFPQAIRQGVPGADAGVRPAH